MRIGLQLLCGLVLIFALAAWFVLEIFVEEIKPGVRSATEALSLGCTASFPRNLSILS